MSCHFLAPQKLIARVPAPTLSLICALLFTWAGTGCLFNSTPTPTAPHSEYPGTHFIASQGSSVQLGDTGPLAGGWESPALTDGFSYSFWMDSTEVTQGRYDSLMGRNPVVTGSSFGSGSDFPVYSVSWYDAALFCNARSKAAGLDTVYAYATLQISDAGSAYGLPGLPGLPGLTVHLERLGYRLPTEAEWEFAAQAGSRSDFPWGELKDSTTAAAFAWFTSNAQGKTHPVARLKPNAFGLYDMAGNVMEWVNDWKGVYPAQPATDFAGARDPGPEYDIPVKGGAFKYGLRELRPANRTATYATIPSSQTEYVGFRCAIGIIPKPAFSTPDGRTLATDKVILDAQSPQNQAGGRAMKLIFINASGTLRHLVYVDYSKSPAQLREFTDRGDVFHPTISPDGKWVAFGTRLEGVDSGSDLYVRALDDSASPCRKIGPGFIPRWWVDPAAHDTFLVYTNSAADDAGTRWADTRTFLQKLAGGMPQGAPRAVTADGGYHDGYSADGRYLATGFRHLRVYDAATATSRVLFTAPQNGKTAGDTSQVCNVSIAPDTTGRTLFLDFGYADSSMLTHGPYGIHQYAFMATPRGDVLRWYKAPPTESGFEDLEWSNNPGYAVTGAADANQNRKRIFLLNLKDSQTVQLASGTELLQPAIWLETLADIPDGSDLSVDSAGAYNDPATDATRQEFANKMHLLWAGYKNFEAAFVGGSQMTDGLDPAQVTCIKGFNLAYGTGDLKGMDFQVRNYVIPNCSKLRMVALSFPIGWINTPDGDVSWSKSIEGSKGLRYDENHDFWQNGLPSGFVQLAKNAPYPNLPVDSLGLYVLPGNGWGGSPLAEWTGPEWATSDTTYQKNFAFLEKLVADLSERKVQVVFVVFPQSPEYANMHSFSAFGPSWTTAGQILDQLSGLQSKYPYFHLIDLNLNGKHNFVDAEAFDRMHLSRAGAMKAGAILNVEFQKILAQ